MSFYQSLEVLKNKILQKNIILVTGNVDETFSMANDNWDKNTQTNLFVSIIEFLEDFGNSNDFKTIEFYSANKGVIHLGNNKIKNTRVSSDADKDFDDISIHDENEIIPFDQYINDITNRLNLADNNKQLNSSIFIIDCSEVFLDKNLNGIQAASLAKLLSNFISYKPERPSQFINQKKKLVLIARNPENISNLIQSRNIEFFEVVISKPNHEERGEFFKKYSNHFSIKNTINDCKSDDFKDAIMISNELSFREILQFSKIENLEYKDLTFKQLYSLITFNKKESDWEKIDIKKMNSINSELTKRVIGQEKAIQTIKTSLIRSFSGLSGITHSNDSKKPKGVLFLTGPTGSGKTELAKALAEFIFGDESRLIRFDMSEYNHEHSDQRLIGAPPGYVGYDAGGQLTNIVKEKPFSILLFDEIEKAHGKILDKFLQILEDGRLTSSKGEIIDFSETFIIFTSNIGTSEISNLDLNTDDEISQLFISSIKKHFNDVLKRPEILNRIGVKNLVPFNFIRDKNIQNMIIRSKLDRIVKKLKEDKLIDISYDESSFHFIFDSIIKNADYKYGGRGLITELETVFIDKLSFFLFEKNEIIFENRKNKKFSKIQVVIKDNIINFELNH